MARHWFLLETPRPFPLKEKLPIPSPRDVMTRRGKRDYAALVERMTALGKSRPHVEQAAGIIRELLGPIAHGPEAVDALVAGMTGSTELGLTLAAEEKTAGWWREGRIDSIVNWMLFNDLILAAPDRGLSAEERMLNDYMVEVGYYIGNVGNSSAMGLFHEDIKAWGIRFNTPGP